MEISTKKNFLKISNLEEESKKEREEVFREYRKINREESIMKKRKEKIFNTEKKTNNFVNTSPLLFSELLNLKKNLLDFDLKKKSEAAIEIRRILSNEEIPPIKEIIDAEIVPILIEFLKNDDCPQLQFEAAWALTNVASGSSDQTMKVVEGGAVLLFIKLLENINENVKEQSMWALGNIAGDSSYCRDIVIESGIIDPLLRQLSLPNRVSFLRNAVWTLSNLFRGKPAPKVPLFKEILKVLSKFIFSEDSGILADVCWAFSYISDGSPEKIQSIIESGVIQRIVELLMHKETIVQTPALRIIGNIATGNDLQTQTIINCGALPCLLTLLNSFQKAIKREVCWTISNITAGDPEQIQSVIDSNLIPTLIYILKHSEMDIKKEAIWAISNAASGGTSKQIAYLVKQDSIKPMVELLSSPDSRVVNVILDGLENILEAGNRKRKGIFVNEYVQYTEQAGGLEKFESLQHHKNTEIYEHAVRILEKFFGAEEETSEFSEKLSDFKNNFQNYQQIPNCYFGFSEQ